jgi:hypothetical protein
LAENQEQHQDARAVVPALDSDFKRFNVGRNPQPRVSRVKQSTSSVRAGRFDTIRFHPFATPAGWVPARMALVRRDAVPTARDATSL